jgi:outer membrane protein OmpA-like peptidoglycan-associated protein
LVTGGRFCAQQTIVEGELVLQSEPPRPRTRARPIAWAVRALGAAGALNIAACAPGEAHAAPTPTLDLGGPGTAPGATGLDPKTPAARPGEAAPTLGNREHLRGDVAPDPRLEARVQFAHKKSTLDATAKAALGDAVAFLLAHGEVTYVAIMGHAASDEGTTLELEALATARAEAVKAHLAQAGIAAERLKTSGYGARSPAADNDTPEHRALNRRVEFSIY